MVVKFEPNWKGGRRDYSTSSSNLSNLTIPPLQFDTREYVFLDDVDEVVSRASTAPCVPYN